MRRLAIVGGGPAGLMAAEAASLAGAAVTVYDRMPSVGRKFLLAGRGGLNLTHSEEGGAFLRRYGVAAPDLEGALDAFSPTRLRTWCADLGELTFVGSSGRVFPRSLKASPLLRAWLRRLQQQGVVLATRHHWRGWTATGALLFATPGGPVAVAADATVLALGGASWPKLGADGTWVATLAAHGITSTPLRPSNCGFVADWSPPMRHRFAGEPLKNIALRFGEWVVRGEAVVTADGLEGGAVYALSGPLRDAIAARGEAVVTIALRPDMTESDIAQRLARQPAKASLSNRLRKALRLPPVAVALIGEARHRFGSDTPIASLVNGTPVRLTAPGALAKAISTAGGVAFGEMDHTFMLRHRPGVFVAGEMLDWEAPTGGYLLQACFATGAAAGRHAAAWRP